MHTSPSPVNQQKECNFDSQLPRQLDLRLKPFSTAVILVTKIADRPIFLTPRSRVGMSQLNRLVSTTIWKIVWSALSKQHNSNWSVRRIFVLVNVPIIDYRTISKFPSSVHKLVYLWTVAQSTNQQNKTETNVSTREKFILITRSPSPHSKQNHV